MSLVFTLASRNLFQDRLRFAASLIGIVFSVVLVMVQMGLYYGFSRMVTVMIDHAHADLWVVARGTKSFEDISVVNTARRNPLLAIDGVADVIPVIVGMSAWILPDGTMTAVIIIGTDASAGGLPPWNIVEGTIQSLSTPETVAIDRSYFDRLGVAGVGATAEIRGEPVTVGAVSDGIRSFTMTPYVFTDLDGARTYTGYPANLVSYFLVRAKPGADIERIRQDILTNVSSVQVLTPDQFREQSRSFWLFGTGAGAALVAGALLSVIVGTAIVAQTLYSSTKDHIYEFATLRAVGASNSYIYKVIVIQALINAVIGFSIAALIGIAVVHFTEKSALQVIMPLGLMAELFLVTIVMCTVSAIAAIIRVVRVDPAIVLTQ